MAGETLMHPLRVVLEHSHVLYCDTGDILMRDHNCTGAGLQDPVDFAKSIMIQVLHGISFFMQTDWP